MMRPCSHCGCEDACGREELVSRPVTHKRSPSPIDVYRAVFSYYGLDRTVADVDCWYLALDLEYLGYLNSVPKLVDVGRTQDLIREVERQQ